MYQLHNKADNVKGAYRSQTEIKEDIRYISERISEVNEALNIRELLSDIFNEESPADAVKRAETVTELLKYAEEALSELRDLNERLDELKAELISSVDMCFGYERGDRL
ncbi:MAG: hypothetical protein E7673_02625 [Ruminococcaceae bacterium]|nr:hypothetical protein [Oscillospiraceae bacterium]